MIGFVKNLWMRLPVWRLRPAYACLRERRSAFAFEFAFVVFEVAYDEFMQEVLDATVSSGARQVQIGNAQSATSANFVATYVCPYANGLLNCNNLFVRVQAVTFTSGACTNGDYYNATKGSPPISGGVLKLGAFYSGNSTGAQGTGGVIDGSPCATANSSLSGYCSAGPQQMMLISAVYVAPSFLAGLAGPLIGHITYNNQYVRAQFSTAAFETENFKATSPTC
jgi:hypothetical protein